MARSKVSCRNHGCLVLAIVIRIFSSMTPAMVVHSNRRQVSWHRDGPSSLLSRSLQLAFAKESHGEEADSPPLSSNQGAVVRLAARAYHATSSNPSSRAYTTRKVSHTTVTVVDHGVLGDYNHYRTMALDSTPDRAISILTRNVLDFLQSAKNTNDNNDDVSTTLTNTISYPCQPGDLGENILVDGITHREFHVGQQYHVGPHVVVEITEPIVPCANLCKLPYINNDKLKPKERIQRCSNFVKLLGQEEGLRGWYAKVIRPGVISLGDTIQTKALDNTHGETAGNRGHLCAI